METNIISTKRSFMEQRKATCGFIVYSVQQKSWDMAILKSERGFRPKKLFSPSKIMLSDNQIIISDNEIYLLIKYIKSVLWRVAKPLSYIEDARCLIPTISDSSLWCFEGLYLRCSQNPAGESCSEPSDVIFRPHALGV